VGTYDVTIGAPAFATYTETGVYLGPASAHNIAARLKPASLSEAVTVARELFVTIVNKEHGAGARKAVVTIVAPGITGRASGMALLAPNGDLGARTGVTLSGASIVDAAWDGKWADVNACEMPRSWIRL
jgi:hypothetical protein